VVYHRHVNKVLDGSVGYAFGEGQQLDRRGITTPANLFSNGLFHVVSAKLDANFIGTGTKVSTVLRLAPGQALFAIDPFQGQISTYDPNLSVSLTQELPALALYWSGGRCLRIYWTNRPRLPTIARSCRQPIHRPIRVGLSLGF
jgi:hypothetical protein